MRISARDLPLLAQVLIRTYGWRGIGRRVTYELSHRSGHLARKLPAEDRLTPAEPGWTWPLRFDLEDIRSGYQRLEDLDAIREDVVADAERVLAGEMKFYGWTWKRVEWPPRWHVNPWTGYEYPREHWTRISDFVPENGDIKDVWEMSRLPFTYLFARAWVLTRDDRYPEAWWRTIEDWAAQNPPNRGVNWKCGQETSLRGVALQFGLMIFAEHPSTTTERLRLVGGLLQASVRRVLPTLRYASSQRNNHAISEAVFLETMAVAGGTSSPVDRAGRLALQDAIADQFYDDGWYAQHSFNYQRLAVHALLWLNRIRIAAGLATEPKAESAVGRSIALMRSAQDNSGWLPNLGPNDGALLFPLTTCAHRDFNPLLTTFGTKGSDRERRPRAAEEQIWLGPRTPTVWKNPTAPGAHIATMRGNRTQVVVRTGTGRHRISHDDVLHIDLWIDGQNVLADPGSYRYTAPPPWNNALASRRVHNAAFVERMSDRRLGRFLSISRPTSQIVGHETLAPDGEILSLRTRDADAILSRTIVRRGDEYIVVDYAEGDAFVARWTLGTTAAVHRTATGTEVTDGVGHIVLYGDVQNLNSDVADPWSAWISPGYAGRLATTALVARSGGVPLVAAFGPANTVRPIIDAWKIANREAHARDWLPGN